MKKRLAAFLPLLLIFMLAGCGRRFLADNEILDIEKNPTGVVTLSYRLEEDGPVKTERLGFELYYREAPITVVNFINLAKEGYYDGLLFHRLATSPAVLQGGAYVKEETEDGVELVERNKLDYTIRGEFKSNGWTGNAHLTHQNGTMAMARTTKPNTATSQFYISIGDNSSLDGDYAIFGKIVDNAKWLTDSDMSRLKSQTGTVGSEVTFKDVPRYDITIVSVTVETYGVDFGKTIKN